MGGGAWEVFFYRGDVYMPDVTVLDPTAEWTVDPTKFRSKGRNTPYAGVTLRGRTRCTIVGGMIAYRDGV